MLVHVDTCQLEPGTHISRKVIARLSSTQHELPDAECREVRPDWGEYLPIVTLPAIERALLRRGLLPHLPDPFVYYFGIVKE